MKWLLRSTHQTHFAALSESCVDDAQKTIAEEPNFNIRRSCPEFLLNFFFRISIMSLSTSSSSEIVPKCRCGNGDMRLFTSHTRSNPNRKFWGCPKWIDGYGCGAFLWKDRASREALFESKAMPCDRDDKSKDLQNLGKLIEDLKKETGVQNLYLQKIYHVLLFVALIMCFGLACLLNM